MKKTAFIFLAGLAIVCTSCSPPETGLPETEQTPIVSENVTMAEVPATGEPHESEEETGTVEPVTEPVKEEKVRYTVAEVVALLEPSVVKIKGEYSLGSGVIFSSSGLVITNNHVVSSDSLVRIEMNDGSEYDGIVLVREEGRDLAIVGIIADHADFPCCALGSSETLEIGEDVLAVGYPLGMEGMVTFSKGIVSSVREIDTYNYIQTDAAINPGNSGGPLINLMGEIIGINTAKYVGIDVEGIGLAIPVDEVKPVIQALSDN